MSYLEINDYLINTDTILYIDTNPINLITITTNDKKIQLTEKEFELIKDKILKNIYFLYLENYGFLNLKNIQEVWKINNESYIIKYKNSDKNLKLNKKNVKGINISFYETIKNFDDSESGSGGGEGTYTTSTPTNVEVGGVPVGTTFLKEKYTNVFEKIFHKYMKPEFTMLNVNPNKLEIGQEINSISISWATSNSQNVSNVELYFEGSLLETNLQPQGTKSYNISSTKLETPGSKTVKGKLTDNKNGTSEKTTSINWFNLMFTGTLDKESISEEEAKKLTKTLSNNPKGTFSFSANGYKYVIVPDSFTINRFYDPNSKFDVDMSQLSNINITNDYGVTQSFKVYRSTYRLGGELTILIE